jgi:hypothetical protein
MIEIIKVELFIIMQIAVGLIIYTLWKARKQNDTNK